MTPSNTHARNDFTEQLWKQTQSVNKIPAVYALLQNKKFSQETL